VADYIDRTLFDKAIDMTSMALRGSMGGENSQPPSYAAEVFKEIWGALKEASKDLPDRTKAGF
jgi:hypothetical protein